MSPLTLLFKGSVITEVRFVAAIATSDVHHSLEQTDYDPWKVTSNSSKHRLS